MASVADLEMIKIILGVIIGTLLAVIYSMRIMVLMERKLARMDINLMRLVDKIYKLESEDLTHQKKLEKKLTAKTQRTSKIKQNKKRKEKSTENKTKTKSKNKKTNQKQKSQTKKTTSKKKKK